MLLPSTVPFVPPVKGVPAVIARSAALRCYIIVCHKITAALATVYLINLNRTGVGCNIMLHHPHFLNHDLTIVYHEHHNALQLRMCSLPYHHRRSDGMHIRSLAPMNRSLRPSILPDCQRHNQKVSGCSSENLHWSFPKTSPSTPQSSSRGIVAIPLSDNYSGCGCSR